MSFTVALVLLFLVLLLGWCTGEAGCGEGGGRRRRAWIDVGENCSVGKMLWDGTDSIAEGGKPCIANNWVHSIDVQFGGKVEDGGHDMIGWFVSTLRVSLCFSCVGTLLAIANDAAAHIIRSSGMTETQYCTK
ncbi:hypothetical protein B0H11DRAFT_1935590 [Mycena galericulata]|nr:hypothetical protein B0H11DRAFT_1935590 [Mycena galericulata]